MKPNLFNTLEIRDGVVAVHCNPAKRRKGIESNLIASVLVIVFGIYAWAEHSVPLIVINSLLGLLTLPLTLFVLWIEIRARKRSAPDIEIDSVGLRFYLASAEPITLMHEDVAELMLMPSLLGQTLIVVPVNDRAMRSRLPFSSLLYLRMSKLYCGHAIGLIPNLEPEAFRQFCVALDRTFPNRVSVRQKAHRPPFLLRLLGTTKPHEAPLGVHVPPPLTRA